MEQVSNNSNNSFYFMRGNNAGLNITNPNDFSFGENQFSLDMEDPQSNFIPTFTSPLDISFQPFNPSVNNNFLPNPFLTNANEENRIKNSSQIIVENAPEYKHWSDDSSNGTASDPFDLSSGSSPWSPDNSNTPPQPSTTSSVKKSESLVYSASEVKLEVILMHKPRGSQGIWQPVPPGAGLRVTKGKGKRLKLQIKTNVEFDKSKVEVQMLDLMTTVSTSEGFGVEQMVEVDSPFMTELELKLSRYYKRVQFVVTVQTSFGPFKSKTIEFCSHNNGKQTKLDALPTPSIPSFSSVTEKHLATGIEDVEKSSSYSEKKRRNEINGEEERISVINGNLEVNGNVRAQAFMQFSDQRLKTNITDLVGALEIMMKLQGKSYQWKQESFSDAVGPNRVIGLIAQEVQRVLPEVVHTDPISGILSVSYAEIIPVIIEGFKQHRLDSMNERQDVYGQLHELRKQLEAVENESKIQKSRMYQHLYTSKQKIMNPHEQFATKLSTFVRILLVTFGVLGICAAMILLARFKRRPPIGSIICLLFIGVGFNLIAIMSYVIQRNQRRRIEKELEERVPFNHEDKEALR